MALFPETAEIQYILKSGAEMFRSFIAPDNKQHKELVKNSAKQAFERQKHIAYIAGEINMEEVKKESGHAFTDTESMT